LRFRREGLSFSAQLFGAFVVGSIALTLFPYVSDSFLLTRHARWNKLFA
jgi:hypothetical protein